VPDEVAMIEIPRILCPVDFSDVSRYALDHAIAIARWYNSHISALHVLSEELIIPPRLLLTEFRTLNGIERRDAAETHLRGWLLPATRDGVPIAPIVEHGDAARVILQHAVRGEFDLVVMGTHGRGGFERLVLGSVAEKVLRKAECPVITVPPRTATGANAPYERLLCPVDFSPSSNEALDFAVSIAEESNADLTILNVVDFPSDDELLFARGEAIEFRRLIEAVARRQLDALVADEDRMRCKPRTRMERGKPYQQILSVAAHERTDLIVMGVRGRNPVDVAIFGSTTNHVVRGASCPVLTVRT